MKPVSQWLQDFFGFSPELQSKIFTSVFIIFTLAYPNHRHPNYDDIDFAYPTQRFYNNALEGKGASGQISLRRTVEITAFIRRLNRMEFSNPDYFNPFLFNQF